MALTTLTANVENHQTLDNNPADDPGFISKAARAEALKILFDKAAVDIKTFINDTLIPELEAELADKLSATTLTTAIETILTEAAASGEFDGADGASVQLQVSETHIQWKLSTAETWTDLIALSALKGDTGETGATGTTGATGPAGRSIASITRTSGTGAAGTTDTYTITFSDSSTPITFSIYNGADGEGSGDMAKATYDPTNKNADAFSADNHVSGSTNKVFTATEQAKLTGIAMGAEVNVNADWNATEGDAQILNKPAIPSGAAPGLTLGTSNSAGSAATFVKTDATIAAFDATAPSTQAFGDSASAGTAAKAARRDHKHAMPSAPTLSSLGGMPIAGGTFTGSAIAQANTSYTTAQLRNVILSTSDPSGGNNGDIWIKYTP